MTAIITKPEQSGELLLKLSRETVPTIDNGKILELRESGASKAQELAIPGRKDSRISHPWQKRRRMAIHRFKSTLGDRFSRPPNRYNR